MSGLLRYLPLLLAGLLLCRTPASAQALRLPPQPAARFSPEIGARLPLDVMLRDERGATLRLGSLFGTAPVVLVPGYYTCPNLCETLFTGVLQALAMSGLKAGTYRLVGVSIDPHDDAAADAADAASRRSAFATLLPGGGADMRLLTGDAAALARLEQALGYHAVRDPATGELAHAAGFVIADADGRIARYFPGVRFNPAELRDGVIAAREGAISTIGTIDAVSTPSLGQRLLLLCTHYDPSVGKHSDAAMAAVRAGVLLILAGLATWLWRRKRGGHGS